MHFILLSISCILFMLLICLLSSGMLFTVQQGPPGVGEAFLIFLWVLFILLVIGTTSTGYLGYLLYMLKG